MAQTAPDSVFLQWDDYPRIRRAALEMAPRDRKALADELLDSLEGVPEEQLEPEEPQLSEAWLREIERRVAAMKSGEAKLIDGEEVMEHMHWLIAPQWPTRYQSHLRSFERQHVDLSELIARSEDDN